MAAFQSWKRADFLHEKPCQIGKVYGYRAARLGFSDRLLVPAPSTYAYQKASWFRPTYPRPTPFGPVPRRHARPYARFLTATRGWVSRSAGVAFTLSKAQDDDEQA